MTEDGSAPSLPRTRVARRAAGPDLQLLGGGGAEGVAGREQHLLAVAGELGGQLADGRGLAAAVDADDEQDERLRGVEVDAAARRATASRCARRRRNAQTASGSASSRARQRARESPPAASGWCARRCRRSAAPSRSRRRWPDRSPCAPRRRRRRRAIQPDAGAREAGHERPPRPWPCAGLLTARARGAGNGMHLRGLAFGAGFGGGLGVRLGAGARRPGTGLRGLRAGAAADVSARPGGRPRLRCRLSSVASPAAFGSSSASASEVARRLGEPRGTGSPMRLDLPLAGRPRAADQARKPTTPLTPTPPRIPSSSIRLGGVHVRR